MGNALPRAFCPSWDFFSPLIIVRMHHLYVVSRERVAVREQQAHWWHRLPCARGDCQQCGADSRRRGRSADAPRRAPGSRGAGCDVLRQRAHHRRWRKRPARRVSDAAVACAPGKGDKAPTWRSGSAPGLRKAAVRSLVGGGSVAYTIPQPAKRKRTATIRLKGGEWGGALLGH